MSVIPDESFACFWDVEPAKLDTQKDAAFIIRRLFECGDLEGVVWLLKTYPKQQLQAELKQHRSLSRRSAFFWANLIDVPLGDISCIRNQFDQPRATAWPY
ncbi:MAG: hypothetical protein Q7S00_00030 [bacterium]|nr:hypothetical protein [bacterium]